jgi:S-(hydroxymethyl)glutathione dehydrogenase / alcohol dehydrogenase
VRSQLCTEIRRARAGLASPLSDSAGPVTVGFGIGTFTEQTVVPAEAVVPIDKSVPFEVAALVGCAVMTGVGAVINTADAVRDLTAGAGFDYVFEVVGHSATLRQAWDATRRGGVTGAVGAGSAADLVSFSAAELYSSERRLMGCL